MYRMFRNVDHASSFTGLKKTYVNVNIIMNVNINVNYGMNH